MLSHQTTENPYKNDQKFRFCAFTQVFCDAKRRRIDFCRKSRMILTYLLIECIIGIQVSGMRHLVVQCD